MRRYFLFIFLLYSTIVSCSNSLSSSGDSISSISSTSSSSSSIFSLPSVDPGETNFYSVIVLETSRSGKKCEVVTNLSSTNEDTSNVTIVIRPDTAYQKIIGIGGSFTESAAYVLNQLSPAERENVLKAYFSTNGAAYTLTRTHIGSCDFTVNGKYSYDDVSNDVDLTNFSVAEDEPDLIPLIQDAINIANSSGNNFKIMASAWTPPVWMKSGGVSDGWYGGTLKTNYYTTFANYISKYITEYKNRGINIWAVSPINEPGGNGNTFESCIFSPTTELNFVNNALGPILANDHPEVLILGFDHNRDGMVSWAQTLYQSPYIDGLAVHWYSSTTNTYNNEFVTVHNLDTNKVLIHSEGCIDSYNKALEGDWWNYDWWWQTNATDWGYDWAGAYKYLHPKYVPVYRYAVDIIETFNNYNMGWIDWNIVLDRNGGPNHVNNWCGAPVLVDTDTKEVFYTPIYYVLKQFSRTIRPDAVRIEKLTTHTNLYILAIKNPSSDPLMQGRISVHILNTGGEKINYSLRLNNTKINYSIDGNTLQTLVINLD